MTQEIPVVKLTHTKEFNAPMIGDSLSCQKPFLHSKKLFIFCAKREGALQMSQLTDHAAVVTVAVKSIY